MARQVVFLVHGIGNHPPKWSADTVTLIDEIGARYPSVTGKVSKQIKFVEIAYGAVFDKQLARWDEDVDKLKADGIVPQAAEALAWLDDATEGGFVWTHIGDVVLFLSRITRMAVVAEVTAQMAKVLGDEDDGDTDFSIVAHSLGTAVTMEAVFALSTPAPDIGWPGLPKKFLFREIMMVSNTSRLLQRPGLLAYTDSTALPKKANPAGVCVTYRNVFHRRDPVSFVRRFDFQAPENSGYVASAVDHYYEKNIHALSHYLEHPAVHGPLLRLPDASNLPAKDFAAAIAEYTGSKRFGGEFAKIGEVDAFIADLGATDKPDPESETTLVSQLQFMVDVLRKMV